MIHLQRKHSLYFSICGIYTPNLTRDPSLVNCKNCKRTKILKHKFEIQRKMILYATKNRLFISNNLNKTFRFFAKVTRIGNKTPDNSGRYVLLEDVIYQPYFVADHVWIRVPLKSFFTVQVGGYFRFHATCKMYERENNTRDYGLEFTSGDQIHDLYKQLGYNYSLKSILEKSPVNPTTIQKLEEVKRIIEFLEFKRKLPIGTNNIE